MKIVCNFCRGIKSYKDVADHLDISRNTVYRRVKNLQDKGILKEETRALPDLEALGVTTIIIGLNLDMENVEKAVDILKEEGKVKAVWKTYGQHDLVSVITCEKKSVGETIENLNKMLQDNDVNVDELDVSTAISCEKLDLTISERLLS